MKRIMIIGVWLIVLIFDGTVLPALTGLPAGFGVVVLLSALAIIFGIHRWLIVLGIILAGVTELILGAYFGTIIGAWLVMAWIWHILNMFLNMNPMSENNSLIALVPFTLFGLGLFATGESVSWMIIRFVYEPKLTITVIANIFSSPVIGAVVAIEFVVVLFIFHFFYHPPKSIYV